MSGAEAHERGGTTLTGETAMHDVDTSDEIETSEVPCSIGHLIDPAQALQAAQRLYAAAGPGICHSGWEGWTVDRKRATQRGRRPVDSEDSDD